MREKTRRCDELRIQPHPVCTGGLTRLARLDVTHTGSELIIRTSSHTHAAGFQFLSQVTDIYRNVTLEFTDGSACEMKGVSFVGHVCLILHHTLIHSLVSPPLLLFCSNVTIAESGKNVWSVVPSVKHGPWFRFYLSRTGSISGVLRAPKPKQGVQDFVCAAQIVAKRMCRWCDFVVFNSETNQIDNPKWCSCTCLHIWLVL